MKKICALILFVPLLMSGLFAGTKKVPSEFTTIQGAINAAVNGDTVLVSPGRYLENIRFKGKKIIVASLFLTTGDRNYILNTIIDGSNPSNPDSASCVLFVNHEDSLSVIEGFTLEKGKGTKWVDEHGAGIYREGGAILSAFASPTIKFNLIQNNEASNNNGTASAGGGGLRCGDGAPRILNNVIINNKALYGGGIVLNYCSGSLVANNIIANNEVLDAGSRPTYSGGGIWLNNTNIDANDKSPNLVYNNTIVGNSVYSVPSGGYDGGGGILCARGIANISNNIIWGNKQTKGVELAVLLGSTAQITYNLIQLEIGTNTIKSNPLFGDSLYILTAGSPAVDAGNPDVSFNDRSNNGNVLFPSFGNVRNDIGAYGGTGSSLLPSFTITNFTAVQNTYSFNLTIPGSKVDLYIPLTNRGSTAITVSNILAKDNTGNELVIAAAVPFSLKPLSADSIKISWLPGQQKLLIDTIIISYNSPTGGRQIKVEIEGSSIPTPLISLNTTQGELGDINSNTIQKDTVIYIYNKGTGADSVNISINYGTVTPHSALSVSPSAFLIAPGDSVPVTFTIYPSTIIKTGLGIYSPGVIVKPASNTQMEKKFRFRIVGTTGINDKNKPGEFALSQNYPNPFNPTTNFKFSLAETGFVSLSIFNILGAKIAVLVNDDLQAGEYNLKYDAAGLASGIYFYTLTSGSFSQTKKFILLR